jgi:hypothetical protein
MFTTSRFALSALKASVASCAAACGIVQAAEINAHAAVDSQASRQTATVTRNVAVAPRAPLDLRLPPLRQVMAHSVLLGEAGVDEVEDAQPVEVAAGPQLMPMVSEQPAPLGLIAAFAWTGDHPAQAWRILLPLADDSIS